MRVALFLVLAPLLLGSAPLPTPATPTGLPKTTKTFSGAKSRMYKLHRELNHQLTVYCGCSYKSYGTRTKVDLKGCDFPRTPKRRDKRVEAEHIFPAHHFGHHRPCWRQKLCSKRRRGKTVKYKGRDCCMKTDPVFRAAHNDLHNLWPAVGSVNGVRSNFRYGVLDEVSRRWCAYGLDRTLRVFSPPLRVRGIAARAHLYMAWRYGFRLSDQQRKLFEAWHQEQPPTDLERQRAEMIRRIQESTNPWAVR